ncbi:hypothetical protein MHYP_G00355900 [Metynnis hypsauchen]
MAATQKDKCQIWDRFGEATIDLFATRYNTQCLSFFSPNDQDALMGVDALAHPWLRVLLYAFLLLALIPTTLTRVKQEGPSLILIAPNWTKEFRKTDQLFVSWARPHIGKPITKQHLSHWIVGAIALAYSSKGMQPPAALRAHSTRGMATSWALFWGISIREICAAANWASPHTFAMFYRLDVTAPTLVHTVLSVCPPEGQDPPARE